MTEHVKPKGLVDQWGIPLRDSLVNFVTGLGTSKDPTVGGQYTYMELNRNELEQAYRSDWIARAVVDAPAEDQTREWRVWHAGAPEVEALEDVEKAHQLQRKLKMALIRARLYGGGALVIGVDDGERPSDPINFDKIKKNALQFVQVFNRYELNAGPRIYNVDSPWYTRPEYYRVATPLFGFFGEEGNAWPQNPSGNLKKDPKGDWALQVIPSYGMVDIHPSRVVEFSGNELPDWRLAPMGGGWGDSVLQTVDEALKDWGAVSGGIAAMTNDAKMDVVKLPGLAERLSTNEFASKLISRFQLANMAKSMINTLILDKEEEWDRVQTSFGGIGALIREYMTIVAGAGRIPLSRLMGNAPGRGLSAAGASGGDIDIRNYFDLCSSFQRTEITPRMEPLDRVLQLSAIGKEDKSIHFEWNPLYRPDPAELAQVALQKAQATQVYVSSGLFNEDVLREAVSNQLIEDGTYPGLEDAIDEHGLEPPEPEPAPPGFVTDPSTGRLIPAAPQPAPAAGGKGGSGKGAQAGPGGSQVTRTGREDTGKTFSSKQAKANSGSNVKDARPMPLYVRRDVVNGDAIVKWAKSQGFETTLPASELHVTICYSRTPVDWMKAGSDDYSFGDEDNHRVIRPGGPRLMDRFGDAIVLLFADRNLQWRHDSFEQCGASWDHSDYQPHITISYNAANLDLDAIDPYRGEIVLGPEIFEQIDDGYRAKLTEDFSPDQPRDEHGRWTSGGGGGGKDHPASRSAHGGEHAGFDMAKFKARMVQLLKDEHGTTDVGSIAQHAIHGAPHLATMIGHEIGMHAVKDVVKEALMTGLSSAIGGAVAGPVGAAIVGAAAALMVHHVSHKLGISHETAHNALVSVVHHLSTHYHQIMQGESFGHLVGRAGSALVHGLDAEPDDTDTQLQRTLIAVGKALQKMRFDKGGSILNDYNPNHEPAGSSSGGQFTSAGSSGSGSGGDERGGAGGGKEGVSQASGKTAPPAKPSFNPDDVKDALDSAAKAGAGYAPLHGLPQKVISVGGKPFVPGPLARAKEAAASYMRDAGLHYEPPADYKAVDPERAGRIAKAFDDMAHDPHDPDVKASYDALIKETIAQYHAIQKTGLRVAWAGPDQQPYKSPFEAMKDVRENNHWVGFPTDSGFGTTGEEAETAKENNPLLAETDEYAGGRRLLANDVFRIVHDYFGHMKEGVGFRANGEENAWRSHAAMYSPLARAAMTSETRGQNSWVNYGPHAEHNKGASETDTVYAPQKIGIMPEWTREEGK